ncbi:hypothetical protein ES703_80226 [subsurface metagenome]
MTFERGGGSSTPGGAGRGQGGGRGRMGGNRSGAGPSGNCICPSCGAKRPHKVGVPCYNEVCPKCGTQMIRE